MSDSSSKPPTERSRELRALAHDLSNSLETIVQASYLLAQAEMPENSRKWVEMIDKASQEAVQINRKLREILRGES
jgi:K+-sensing histidine kinase KdpD